MNILVLNGSPKGEYSITLQTIRFLHSFNLVLFPSNYFGNIISFQFLKNNDFKPSSIRFDGKNIQVFICPYQSYRDQTKLPWLHYSLYDILPATGSAQDLRYNPAHQYTHP